MGMLHQMEEKNYKDYAAVLSGSFPFFVCCLFLVFIPEASAWVCDYGNVGNYTVNSPYHKNLNTLLSSFSSHTEINYGFYNFSYGRDPDKVYAVGLCRGDQKQDECLKCLNHTRGILAKQCPNQKEAIGWGGECMLRYSNRSIIGIVENEPLEKLFYTLNVTGRVNSFNAVLQSLMRNLTSIAASGDSRRKYATGSAPAPEFQTIYGYTQCTPDLTSEGCTNCLKEAIALILDCCSGRSGGNVLKPNCRIRFDPYIFYGPTVKLLAYAPLSPSTTNASSSQGKSHTSRTVITIAVPVACFVLVFSLLCIYLSGRQPRKKVEFRREEDGDEDEITFTESLQFNFDTLRVATNEFAESNKLGHGGFGVVYRGKLSNGQMIAVKRLSRGSGQGHVEFKNEVVLVAKLQHRNLVRLLGFCFEGQERLLVYEYLPNRSLDNFIFDPTKHAHLDWKTRYKIIEGIAGGLLYLHRDSRQRIIHRDLKLSNILLDAEMNPKISDFGLAKLFEIELTHLDASKIAGTFGYMAPEYARHGKLSIKLDVFSFGVMLLEIASGQKNGGFRNGENVEHLLSFAWKNWRKGTADSIIDPALNNDLRGEIVRCIHIGLLCVQEKADDRPTMAEVVLMLDSHSFALPVPLQPAYFINNSRLSDIQFLACSSVETGSYEQKSYCADASVNETSISCLYPR